MDGIAVIEELAKADASVAWCVWNGNTHWTAAQLSAEAARAIHDDPDVITANSTRPSGQAHVVDGGFRLTGRWSLVSGCELAKAIHRLKPQLPVILVTGYRDADTLLRAEDAGVAEILDKPLNTQVLAAALSRQLAV